MGEVKYGWHGEFKGGDKVLLLGKLKGKVVKHWGPSSSFWQVPVAFKGSENVHYLNSRDLEHR